MIEGRLPCRSREVRAGTAASSARLNGQPLEHQAERKDDRLVFSFTKAVVLEPGNELLLET